MVSHASKQKMADSSSAERNQKRELMGAVKRDLEEKTLELADVLAKKLMGRDFGELPHEQKYSVWNQAEEKVRNDMISAAEYRYERDR